MSIVTFNTPTSNCLPRSNFYATLSNIETVWCMGKNFVISKPFTAQMLCSAPILEQFSPPFKIYGVQARIVQGPKISTASILPSSS